ncbi:hypothetical protein CPB97_008515 [Podila verticillata]|nr:hypothetical protein CPB97_008515 [Podila verticillata]
MIAGPLLLKDLVHCIPVNQTWYDALIRILWLDIMTYRSHKTKHLLWEYQHYFRTSASRQTLAKRSRHIRAITCQNRDIFATLLSVPHDSPTEEAICSLSLSRVCRMYRAIIHGTSRATQTCTSTCHRSVAHVRFNLIWIRYEGSVSFLNCVLSNLSKSRAWCSKSVTAEIQWMKQSWPRLRSIEPPVFDSPRRHIT